jgi:hypothetical protein
MNTEWKRSSYCANGTCVEISRDDDGCIVVKDSKQDGLSDQPVLCFRPDEWKEFIKGVKNGEFDVS